MVHMGADGYYKVAGPDTWKLVKAVQQLKADNDNLRKRVEAMESARR
jgi:hypothetical protein